MSTSAVNRYLIERTKITSYESLIIEIGNLKPDKYKSTLGTSVENPLLSKLKSLCMYMIAYHRHLNYHSLFNKYLTDILYKLNDSDVERKSLRTLLAIFLEAITLMIHSNNETLFKFEYVLIIQSYLYKEFNSSSIIPTKKAYIARALGDLYHMINKLQQTSSTPLLPPNNEQDFQQVLFSNLDLVLRIPIDKENKDHKDNKLVILNYYSSLRRMNYLIDSDEGLELLFRGLQTSSSPISRHVLSILQSSLSKPSQTASFYVSSTLFLIKLFEHENITGYYKDNLAVHYLFQCIHLILLKSQDPVTLKYPPDVLTMVYKSIQIMPPFSIKYAYEVTMIYLHPNIVWQLLPQLYDSQPEETFNLIDILAKSMADFLKKFPVEDLRTTAVLKACQLIGKTLISRPDIRFGTQYSHRLFVAKTIEQDGNAIITLWVTLRAKLKQMLLPSLTVENHPEIIRKLSKMTNIKVKGNWLYETDQPSIAAKALLNIPLFVSLIQTCLWIAPDIRYARRDHDILWKMFVESLQQYLFVLNASTQHEILLGDPSNAILDLLSQVHQRLQLSLLVSLPSKDENSKMIFIQENKIIIQALVDLSSLSLKLTFLPRLTTLLPSIWSTLLSVSQLTKKLTYKQFILDALSQHLLTVIQITDGANRFRKAVTKELVSSFTLHALVSYLMTKVLWLEVNSHLADFIIQEVEGLAVMIEDYSVGRIEYSPMITLQLFLILLVQLIQRKFSQESILCVLQRLYFVLQSLSSVVQAQSLPLMNLTSFENAVSMLLSLIEGSSTGEFAAIDRQNQAIQVIRSLLSATSASSSTSLLIFTYINHISGVLTIGSMKNVVDVDELEPSAELTSELMTSSSFADDFTIFSTTSPSAPSAVGSAPISAGDDLMDIFGFTELKPTPVTTSAPSNFAFDDFTASVPASTTSSSSTTTLSPPREATKSTKTPTKQTNTQPKDLFGDDQFFTATKVSNNIPANENKAQDDFFSFTPSTPTPAQLAASKPVSSFDFPDTSLTPSKNQTASTNNISSSPLVPQQSNVPISDPLDIFQSSTKPSATTPVASQFAPTSLPKKHVSPLPPPALAPPPKAVAVNVKGKVNHSKNAPKNPFGDALLQPTNVTSPASSTAQPSFGFDDFQPASQPPVKSATTTTSFGFDDFQPTSQPPVKPTTTTSFGFDDFQPTSQPQAKPAQPSNAAFGFNDFQPSQPLNTPTPSFPSNTNPGFNSFQPTPAIPPAFAQQPPTSFATPSGPISGPNPSLFVPSMPIPGQNPANISPAPIPGYGIPVQSNIAAPGYAYPPNPAGYPVAPGQPPYYPPAYGTMPPQVPLGYATNPPPTNMPPGQWAANPHPTQHNNNQNKPANPFDILS